MDSQKHMDSQELRYGPSWKAVVDFVDEVSSRLSLDNPEPPETPNESILVVPDKQALAEVIGCELDLAGPERWTFGFVCESAETNFTRFLLFLDEVDTGNALIAERNKLDEAVEHAVNDACNNYPPTGCEDFFDLVGAVPETHKHPCEFSVQAHVGYIATELVLAHLTEIHLFRDMWHWYRRGHWPCGWEGEWPDGRLVVY